MAMTHMLGLERVQYRTLTVALGLMGCTPNKCLGVLSGIPPLAERFAYLNFRYFVAAFNLLGPPFEGKAWSAGGAEHGSLHQGIFRSFVSEYSSVQILHVA
jgi:hypothetical protein